MFLGPGKPCTHFTIIDGLSVVRLDLISDKLVSEEEKHHWPLSPESYPQDFKWER